MEAAQQTPTSIEVNEVSNAPIEAKVEQVVSEEKISDDKTQDEGS